MLNDDNRWLEYFIDISMYVYGNRQATDRHGTKLGLTLQLQGDSADGEPGFGMLG